MMTVPTKEDVVRLLEYWEERDYNEDRREIRRVCLAYLAYLKEQEGA